MILPLIPKMEVEVESSTGGCVSGRAPLNPRDDTSPSMRSNISLLLSKDSVLRL